MFIFLSRTAWIGSVASLALLAGCAEHSRPVAAATPYNPPGTALAELPASSITWYHVMFANDSYQIDATGQQAISDAASSMKGNDALIATVIGRSDAVGDAGANMHLSRQRADAVRAALLQTGIVPARRIETRWTGERQQGSQTASDVADVANRVVDIGVH
jgi:outer membrane protein OmpA-like peptidoglycan-associated protein